MSDLFSPTRLGNILLKNKIVMAPLTRARAGKSRIPNQLMADYYRQRASAGLIITEATSIHPMGVGYANTPGIWSEEQIEGWKKITRAVHDEGGTIFMQLWHVGRISHPIFLNGEFPLAPSALKPKGRVSLIRPETNYVTPRELTNEEIKKIIVQYKIAAENAKKAGFDGVEIHAANGYLIDQFLQDTTNQRKDEYGGSIENRARFLMEITDSCIEVWGADRVGVHLAPRGDAHDMGDSNKLKLFTTVAKLLNEKRIAFIFTREYRGLDSVTKFIRQVFNGKLIVNEKYERDTAIRAIENNEADLVSFGLNYISNPDLVTRLKNNFPLNQVNPETIYTDDQRGYTDYPFYKN